MIPRTRIAIQAGANRDVGGSVMKVVCAHCKLPFSVARVVPGRAVYCCSGCALAARVPVDAQGQFPVNAALLGALGLGFAFFNQALFWLLAVLVARDPEGAANATRLGWASFGVGWGAWMGLAWSQFQAGARRPADVIVGALTLGLWAWAALRASLPLAVLANALFAAWALRGLRR